nr:MAG: ORF1 [Torque teno midi virus]
MPFWWKRRKRPWFGRWGYQKRRRYRRRFYKPRTRRRRGRPTRRRRRRRRRYKVRRKKRKITIQQWQPDSIRKCKIKAIGTICMGAQGSQYKCYTNEASRYPPPKEPSGGGFGVEIFSLQDLYNRYKAHKCIWTESNDYKDLCRYTGCKFIFYRHMKADFIVSYELQPPFTIDKYTYPQAHPLNQLLQKHKKIIHSIKHMPYKNSKVVLKIRPPKTMRTKWFFQKELATVPLVKIQAAACDFSYANMGNTWASNMLSIYFLNTSFYQESNWGNAGLAAYLPYKTIDHTLKFWYKDDRGQTQHVIPQTSSYHQSINYSTGYFSRGVLNAYSINKLTTDTPSASATLPVGVGRYNPQTDTGEGNELWLVSSLTEHYDHPASDSILIFKGYPLWMMFFGYKNYIEKAKGDPRFLDSYFFVFRCPSMQKLSGVIQQDYYPFFDQSFLNGKMPFDEYLSENNKKFWYPTVRKQLETINTLVTLGPYIPKYKDDRDSTWELNYKCIFYFKWGGPQFTEKPAVDPEKQGTYPAPNMLTETVQIANPLTQKYETMFHNWDYRRGLLTKTAIKRMFDNISINSDVQTTTSAVPPKKRKITGEIPALPQETKEIQDCLLSLFEEDTFQEEEDLKQLIKKQHQQQQQLKYNLLKLISDLKKQQQFLQMQTGNLH